MPFTCSPATFPDGSYPIVGPTPSADPAMDCETLYEGCTGYIDLGDGTFWFNLPSSGSTVDSESVTGDFYSCETPVIPESEIHTLYENCNVYNTGTAQPPCQVMYIADETIDYALMQFFSVSINVLIFYKLCDYFLFNIHKKG